MDKSKVIDITTILKNRPVENAPWVQDGIDVLNSLHPEDAQAVLQFMLNYTFKEVEAGLGLVEFEGGDDIDLQVADKIAEIYERAAGGCYFCSKSVDPNEDEFGPSTKLCLKCKLKLANFTEALGIPSDRVFKGVPKRPQKTRLIVTARGFKLEPYLDKDK